MGPPRILTYEFRRISQRPLSRTPNVRSGSAPVSRPPPRCQQTGFGQNPPFDTDTKIADDRITDKGDTLVDVPGDKGNAAQIALGISQAFRARPPRAHTRFFARLIAELVCF